MDKHILPNYFILDPLKSSYKSFDFWREWIQEGSVFSQVLSFPIGTIFEGKYNEMTKAMNRYIDLYKELEKEQVRGHLIEVRLWIWRKKC